jgi:hypothetical protein
MTDQANPRTPLRYLLRTDQPFDGAAQSMLLPDGTVAWSDGQTLDQYIAERGMTVRVVDEAEMHALFDAFAQSLVTDPTPETFEEWDDALNVLPPCRWGHHRGVELFHISERTYGDIVSWHARIGSTCYTWSDRATATRDALVEKVAAVHHEEIPA